jgi:hypothetical protein
MEDWETKCVASINKAFTYLLTYKEIKQSFEMSDYLTILNSNKFRIVVARFRLSLHCLAIEQGHHRNQIRSNRNCLICTKDDIKNEFHFVCMSEV